MPKRTPKSKKPKSVEALTHADAKRKNIPTAEFESVMRKDEKTPIQLAYERRNRDLDPQLVWRGKDEQDWSGGFGDLSVGLYTSVGHTTGRFLR
jgi:adenine-specific DNA-methyltransferase